MLMWILFLGDGTIEVGCIAIVPTVLVVSIFSGKLLHTSPADMEQDYRQVETVPYDSSSDSQW
jgi:hypothetical protein